MDIQSGKQKFPQRTQYKELLKVTLENCKYIKEMLMKLTETISAGSNHHLWGWGTVTGAG